MGFRLKQGGALCSPPTPHWIFNTVVDAIARECPWRVLCDRAMTAGVGEEIRKFLMVFYADNGLVQARGPVLLQTLLDTLVSLLEHVINRTNVSKTKKMVCVPWRIRTC